MVQSTRFSMPHPNQRKHQAASKDVNEESENAKPFKKLRVDQNSDTTDSDAHVIRGREKIERARKMKRHGKVDIILFNQLISEFGQRKQLGLALEAFEALRKEVEAAVGSGSPTVFTFTVCFLIWWNLLPLSSESY